jgi:ketosteroid isomerase-like protein
MFLEDEKIAGADWGFVSESIFNQSVPGRFLIESGADVDDPEAWYVIRRRIAMIWHYDDRARMIGEHVYEDATSREIIKLAPEDVVTPEQAREALAPLIRPLPNLLGEVGVASANVDLVRSIHAAWERGDWSSVEWAHPDIEFVIADGPSPGSWTGLAGMTEGWRDFLTAWEEYRVEADEYRELDGERVLVLAHLSARGKTSGLEIGQMRTQDAAVFHVRSGQVTRIVLYFDRERALTDLGLAAGGGAQHS